MVQVPIHLVEPTMKLIEGMGEKLSLRTAVKLGRVHMALEEWQVPFSERMQGALKDHLNEGENNITPDHENWDAFSEAIQELHKDDAELKFEPLSFDELEGVEVTPVEARLLFEAGVLTE